MVSKHKRRDQAALAARMRAAEGAGRVIEDLPLDLIDANAIPRDRVALDAGALEELQASIRVTGLRLPIEVYRLPSPRDPHRYGLISGFRRLMAVTQLRDMMDGTAFTTIRALVSDPGDGPQDRAALMRMVEENEVRAGITPYERGRIAAVAQRQGHFINIYAAVDGLFAVASKAKRSKIRAFAEVFVALGDLLEFGDEMSERQGLRLASAIRDGSEAALREAVEVMPAPRGFADEWAVLEPVVAAYEAGAAPARAPRRVRRAAQRKLGQVGDTLHLASGFTITQESDGRAFVLRVAGRPVPRDMGEALVHALKNRLDLP
ncbi:MAG: ParB N-terminal domain-containing protein [Pseudomonadota bacterium]